jgi:hypothetical protein
MGCPATTDVKVIDDYPQLTIQQVGQDIVNFFDDLGDKAELAVGDIIASAKDGGFLRKIIGVNETNGIVQTVTQAVSLAEAIKEGVLTGKISWTNTDFENSGAVLQQGGTLAIDLSGLTIFSQDGVSLSMGDGSSLTYAPDINLDATIADHKMTSFTMSCSGEFTTDLNFKLAASKAATVNWETPMIPAITKPFLFYIGPVPVVGVASLSFPVGVTGGIGAGASAESGFSGSSNVTIGASMVNGNWTNNSSFGQFSPVAHPLVITLSSSGSVTVYVKVVPSITLYDASTLSGYAMPYITGAAQFIPSPFTFDLYAGLNGGINYQLSLFDFNLINKSWFFPGPQWPLYHYSYPYDIPTTFTFNLP